MITVDSLEFTDYLNALSGSIKKHNPLPRYFIFSGIELVSFILCLVLDISEYIAAILMMPVLGDMLDIAGIIMCLLMFHWVGVISLFELIPGADIFPIFVISWLAWYIMKKTRKEKIRQRTRHPQM
jgi:hypothetical protein